MLLDTKTCSLQDCDNEHLAKGLCRKHYARVRRHGDTELQPILTVEQKFHSRYKIVRNRKLKSPCWIWTGALYITNYGQFHNGVKKVYAHRYSYELYNGEISEDQVIRHRCDNPSCVNADHLLSGTHKDNVNDKIKRGRQLKGSQIGNSKLTEDQVLDIVSSSNKKIPQSVIMDKYNISRSAIYSIISGTTWSHLTNIVKEGV